jgi:hypothetical protein
MLQITGNLPFTWPLRAFRNGKQCSGLFFFVGRSDSILRVKKGSWVSSGCRPVAKWGLLVLGINKPIPCLYPQTPQLGVLTNKIAGICNSMGANLLETPFRVGVYLAQLPSSLNLENVITRLITGRPKLSAEMLTLGCTACKVQLM